MATGIRIETPRLILRNIDPARDFAGWAQLMADEQAVRFIGGVVMDRATAVLPASQLPRREVHRCSPGDNQECVVLEDNGIQRLRNRDLSGINDGAKRA